MAWSYKAGPDRGPLGVKVYEREPGGSIHVSYYEDGERVRRCASSIVGTTFTDREVAVVLAERLAAKLAAGDKRETARLIHTASRRKAEYLSIADLTDAPLEDMIATRFPADAISCVYFLLLDGEVRYIGKSVDLGFRLYYHRRNRNIDFDEVAVWPVPEEHLERVEAFLIARFNPPANSRPEQVYPQDVERLRALDEPSPHTPNESTHNGRNSNGNG